MFYHLRSILWSKEFKGNKMSLPKSIQYGTQENLSTLIQAVKENIFFELNCHQIGEIVSFNPASQTAEVIIKMKGLRNDKIVDYPLLVDCPVVVMGGGAGRITFPIEKGDSCLVLFNDRDIDNWFSSGQSLPPRTRRKHSFSDAVCLVGPRNKSNSIGDYLPNGTEIKYANSTIKLQNNQITITNGASVITLNNGTVSIQATQVDVTAPTINLNGTVNASGVVNAPTVAVSGSLTVSGKDIGPSHVHSNGNQGQNTGGVV